MDPAIVQPETLLLFYLGQGYSKIASRGIDVGEKLEGIFLRAQSHQVEELNSLSLEPGQLIRAIRGPAAKGACGLSSKTRGTNRPLSIALYRVSCRTQ